MQKKQILRCTAWLLCLMFTLLTCSTAALAYGSIDTSRSVSLTMNVTQDDPQDPTKQIALAGVTFYLYRIADVASDTTYTLVSELTGCGIDVNAIKDAGEMSDAASAMRDYIYANRVQSISNAVSDKSGKLTFSGLTPGLYLVLGMPTEIGVYAYSFSPVMIALPSLEGDTWVYDQVCDVKMIRTEQTMDLTVIKSWTNEQGDTSKRPVTITVDLLCDGELFSTITLDASNGWKYTIFGLSAAHQWSVYEHPVGDFYKATYGTVVYDSEGTAHIQITNKYTTPPEVLPQTGLLWWPVPVLAFAGIILFVVGWTMSRKGRKSHD